MPVRRSAASPPLFWVHGDASDALVEDALGAGQTLFFLKHQSRDGRQASFAQVETIAASYLAQVRFVQPDGPYFLGGYSFGGTIAFEIARQLEADGQGVALLFMIDSLAPGTDVRTDPPVVAGGPGARSGGAVRRHLLNLSRLGPRAALQYLGVRAKGRFASRMAQLKEPFQRAVLRLCLAVKRPLPRWTISPYLLDLYYKAIASYAPQPHQGRAVYIKSEDRPSHHVSQWRRLVLDGMEVHEIPGSNHTTIIDGPHAAAWVAILERSLRAAQSAHDERPSSVQAVPRDVAYR